MFVSSRSRFCPVRS
jgi:hypothetical protein